LIVLGSVELFKNHSWAALGLGASIGAIGLISIGYNTDDSLVYLVPMLPLAICLLADGIGTLDRWAIPAWVGLIVPILLLVVNWQAIALSDNHLTVDWIRDTVRAIPDNAVVLTTHDRHTFGLWYALEAQSLRSDIVVIDARLWEQTFYRRYLASSMGMNVRRLDSVVDLAGARPICNVDITGVQCP
jgi:hypothetical protein